MATRSLTEAYILLRNNAVQSRNIYNEQIADDRMALVHHHDAERGEASHANNRLPPEWVDGVEEVQYGIGLVWERLKDLNKLHGKHLTQPSLDESLEEQRSIECATQEVTQMLMRCQRLVQKLASNKVTGSGQQQRIRKNVMAALAGSLSELSVAFRKTQSSYLRKMQSREETSKNFLTFDGGAASSSLMEEEKDEEIDSYYAQEFTQEQLEMVKNNSGTVTVREQEITNIIRSISDLNSVFKDLGGMVEDQGTVLDRIDYNVEQTSTKVDEGMKQLRKAANYQKKNRKMYIILMLFIICVVLIVILIAVKS